MSFLTCTEACTLVQMAERHHVHHRDLWLPLDAALPPRAGKNAFVTVEAHTPIALLDTATNALSFDKRSICVRLQVANALSCEHTSVNIAPSLTPGGCTVFVRWTRKGTKHIQPGTQVLHYEAATKTPPSSGSPATPVKRSRAAIDQETGSNSNSVDASTLAETLRGKHQRVSVQQRSTEDLERRLSAAIQSLGRPLHPRSLHILSSTLSNIQHRSAEPPLHFVVPASAQFVEAGGVSWARSNRRLLSRVFRASSSAERSEASRYSDGSRQLRFYFIEDVLLSRPHAWAAPSTETEVTPTDVGASPPSALDEAEFLMKDNLLADINSYAERGYRIVFLEHYPVLHHGSRFTVEKTLAPVVRLCREYCSHLTITVVLSAMSCVTAVRRQGMELSFVMPQAGIIQSCVAEMNTSLQPDPKTAFLVGSSTRGSDFLSHLHREFARNACLTYVDVSELT